MTHAEAARLYIEEERPGQTGTWDIETCELNRRDVIYSATVTVSLEVTVRCHRLD